MTFSVARSSPRGQLPPRIHDTAASSVGASERAKANITCRHSGCGYGGSCSLPWPTHDFGPKHFVQLVEQVSPHGWGKEAMSD